MIRRLNPCKPDRRQLTDSEVPAMSLRLFNRPFLLGMPLVLIAGTLAGAAVAAPNAAAGEVHITTLSTRADLVSGGDVLARIGARGVDPESIHVRLNGRDVTNHFQQHSD